MLCSPHLTALYGRLSLTPVNLLKPTLSLTVGDVLAARPGRTESFPCNFIRDSRESAVSICQSLMNGKRSAILVNRTSEIVTNDGQEVLHQEICGIITKRDYLEKVAAQGRRPGATKSYEIMTPSPFCVCMETPLHAAASMMLHLSCRHLPVIKRDVLETEAQKLRPVYPASSVLDILRMTDIFQGLHELHKNNGPFQRWMESTTVGTLFEGQKPVLQLYSARPDESIMTSIHEMVLRRIGCMPVIEGQNIVGILTETDIAKILYSPPPLRERVSEVMSKDLVVAAPSFSISQAFSIMMKKNVRHLPLIDNIGNGIDWDSRCVGILSIKDLVAAMFEERLPMHEPDAHRMF